MVVKIGDEGNGTLFRAAALDRADVYHNRAIKLAFFKDGIVASSDGTEEKSRIAFPPKQYVVSIVELNTVDQTISTWQRPKGKDTKMVSGPVVPVSFERPLRLRNYEFGNTNTIKNIENARRVEMPAVAIYTCKLTEDERLSLATTLFKSLKNPKPE